MKQRPSLTQHQIPVFFLFVYPSFMRDSQDHNDSQLDSTIAALARLRLSQRQEVQSLLRVHEEEEARLLSSLSPPSEPPRIVTATPVPSAPVVSSSTSVSTLASADVPDHLCDIYKRPLSIGDRVLILTTAKTGRKGETAKVVSLGARIGIRVRSFTTNRASHNLRILRSKRDE